MTITYHYLIGLGSNLAPFDNIPRMVEVLLTVGERVVVSRFVQTEPVGMHSDHLFLNGVAYLETDLASAPLKAYFNETETSLGRDRTDPQSSVQDRPADFDIIANFDPQTCFTPDTVPQEPYCQLVLEELLGQLGRLTYTPADPADGVSLELHKTTFGHKPCEISKYDKAK